jgi:hypothetical protein
MLKKGTVAPVDGRRLSLRLGDIINGQPEGFPFRKRYARPEVKAETFPMAGHPGNPNEKNNNQNKERYPGEKQKNSVGARRTCQTFST